MTSNAGEDNCPFGNYRELMRFGFTGKRGSIQQRHDFHKKRVKTMLIPGELKNKAEAGDGVSMFMLGMMYLKGTNGVQENKDIAKKLLVKAFPKIKKMAEKGDPYSQFCMGYYYDKLGWFIGDDRIVDTHNDNDKILPWYTKAAEQGVAEAQYELGMLYWVSSSIVGAEYDPEKAFDLFKKSAEQGNADAQTCLGRCYENGEGTEVDKRAAFLWITKAAEQGNKAAQTNLGRYYSDGVGTKKDFEKAFHWFTQAMENGDTYAIEYLGECYEKGLGVEKDLAKAIELYKQATGKTSA